MRPMTRPTSPRVLVGLLAMLVLAGQAPGGPVSGNAPPGGQAPPAAAPPPPGIAAFERVTFRSESAGGADVPAYFRRPPGTAPVPVVIGLHGCGGLITTKGEIAVREADWAERWVAAGYGVLLVDSFNGRGYREVCSLPDRERKIVPADRAVDAAAAVTWLATRPGVDRDRIALVGWSHGAMSALWAAGGGAAGGIKTVIAFYPGCRAVLQSSGWAARVPLTMLVGALDDWTAPGPCRELAGRPNVRVVEYPGAYHGFDAPASPVRVRGGVGNTKSGTAHVGTDPAARAAAIIEVRRLLAEAFR